MTLLSLTWLAFGMGMTIGFVMGRWIGGEEDPPR
jgi:hypothetical protein